jgi:dTDP-4-dehydrorhamnose reductase
MRILITGSGSQLTAPLTAACAAREHTVTACSHEDLDIRDQAGAEAAAAGCDAIVNLAAANSVDACETDPIWAYEGNALGPMRLARAARAVGATIVHISTDFVHGGAENPPDYYDEAAPARPVNVYGHAKWMGEEAVAAVGGPHYVLRTAWVVGERFLGYVRSSIEKGDLPLPPVGHACPTIAQDLCEVIVLLLDKKAPWGLYNVVNPPATDRPALLRALVEALGGDPGIVRISEDTRPAPRPTHSALSVEKLASAGIEMPPWQESLDRFVAGEPSLLRALG